MSFPRYPKYKDSGVEWLGEVPEHWEVKPLRHLVRFLSGGTPSKTNQLFWSGFIPWASSKDLKTETLADTSDHITQLAIDEGAAELVPAGTVLVVVRGMILIHTFPVVQTLVPMAINQDLKALIPFSDLCPNYLAWLLRGSSAETLGRVDEAGHGTKVLRMESWTSIRLPLPTRVEQAAIATFLDRETAKIDALIAEQQRLIELLQEKRQAVISHAVTKGLNPDAPMKDSGIEWLGQVPAHWEVVAAKRLLTRIEQGWSPSCLSRPAEDKEWGVLKTGCVNHGIFSQDENKALPDSLEPVADYEIHDGDLLMSRASGSPSLVGSIAYIRKTRAKLMLSDKIFRLHPSSKVTPQFIALLFGSPVIRFQIERDISGAEGLANNLPQAALKVFACAIPPINEQGAIVTYIHSQLQAFDQLAETTQRATALLQERRSALISAAVTGQIDVRHASQGAAA